MISAWQTILPPGEVCYFWASEQVESFPTIGPYNQAAPAELVSLSSGRTYPTETVQWGQGYANDAAYHRGFKVRPDQQPGEYYVSVAGKQIVLDRPIEVMT